MKHLGKILIGAVAFGATLYGINEYHKNPPTSIYSVNVNRSFLYPEYSEESNETKDKLANLQKEVNELNSKNEYNDLAFRFENDSFGVYLKTDEGFKKAEKLKESKLEELSKKHDENIGKIKKNYAGIRKELRKFK